MRKTLNTQQIRNLLNNLKGNSRNYEILAEELLSSHYVFPGDFTQVLRDTYEENKNKDGFQSLAATALSLLHIIHLDTLYDELPVNSTVFVNDLAVKYHKNDGYTYYYQMFSIKTDRKEGEELHTTLTPHIARLMNLKQEELKGNGKFHTQLVLSYNGYAWELVRNLAESLYDDPETLRCEVF